MGHFSSGRCQISRKMKLSGTLENRRKTTNFRIKKCSTALKIGLFVIKKYLISIGIQKKNSYHGVGVHFKKMQKGITTREWLLLNKKNQLSNHSFCVVISRKLKIGNFIFSFYPFFIISAFLPDTCAAKFIFLSAPVSDRTRAYLQRKYASTKKCLKRALLPAVNFFSHYFFIIFNPPFFNYKVKSPYELKNEQLSGRQSRGSSA